jgi:hypothetical protein
MCGSGGGSYGGGGGSYGGGQSYGSPFNFGQYPGVYGSPWRGGYGGGFYQPTFGYGQMQQPQQPTQGGYQGPQPGALPPPNPGAGGTGPFTRPPGTGAITPPPPPYPNAPPQDTRPVNQPSWGTPQPYTSFPQFTQPGNLNSVGPGGPQPNTGTNPPNSGTPPPAQPPTNGRPPFAGQPKIGMQGRIISDNFDGSPSAQPQMLNAPTTSGVGMRDPNDNSPNLPQYAIGSQPPGGSPAPGLFNTIATGQGGGAFQPQDINRYGPGGGGWGDFLNWYGENNAQLNRQGPMYQPGGMFYGR